MHATKFATDTGQRVGDPSRLRQSDVKLVRGDLSKILPDQEFTSSTNFELVSVGFGLSRAISRLFSYSGRSAITQGEVP
jgi:hypothetical protein